MLRPKWIFSGIRVDEESGVGGAGVTFGGQAPAEDRLRAWLRKGPALWLILQDWKTARWVLGIGGMAAMMIIPIFTTGYWSTVLATGIIFALVGLSLVILTGWAGQVSLAQYAFVGVGAYTAAILQGTAHLPFWLVVPLTVLVSVPFSLLIGIPSLGKIVSDATPYYADYALYLWAPVTVFILLTLSLNLLGDSIRDAFDPKTRR